MVGGAKYAATDAAVENTSARCGDGDGKYTEDVGAAGNMWWSDGDGDMRQRRRRWKYRCAMDAMRNMSEHGRRREYIEDGAATGNVQHAARRWVQKICGGDMDVVGGGRSYGSERSA